MTLSSLINLPALYNNECIVAVFWIVAVSMSILFGIDGVHELREEESEDAEEKCKNFSLYYLDTPNVYRLIFLQSAQ